MGNLGHTFGPKYLKVFKTKHFSSVNLIIISSLSTLLLSDAAYISFMVSMLLIFNIYQYICWEMISVTEKEKGERRKEIMKTKKYQSADDSNRGPLPRRVD